MWLLMSCLLVVFGIIFGLLGSASASGLVNDEQKNAELFEFWWLFKFLWIVFMAISAISFVSAGYLIRGAMT